MVARIRSGKSLKGAVNYNENKVERGRAELIMAMHYTKGIDKLNFHEKLNRLQNLADLNLRTATHCLHLSLNFEPSENLSKETLQSIAAAYMKGIGFERQPYLVYEHRDAAHQHLHIVSTNIQRDGSRISLHNLGRTLSENTRKEIEVKFNLVRAGEMDGTKQQRLRQVNLSKALYGKEETKMAITNIVNQVVSGYKFASLAEFNAILLGFNILADRGTEGTRMFEKGGLQYSLLDANGQKIGVPIKASSIFGKPTLKYLEAHFNKAKAERQVFRKEVKNRVLNAISNAHSGRGLAGQLASHHIDLVLRRNGDSFIYGVTYVDHQTKTVFNGSELGKECSAAAIRSKYDGEEIVPADVVQVTKQDNNTREKEERQTNPGSKILDMLTEPSSSFDYITYHLKRRRRKKKGRAI